MSQEDNIHLDHLKSFFENYENLPNEVADFFPGIVYVYDAKNNKLRYINKKITDILGYDFDEIHNWDDAILKIVFKDDVELVKKELEVYQSLENTRSHSYNCRLNHKNGDWRHFHTMGTVLRRDDKNKPASYLFIAQDITDQLKSEDELKKTRELFRDTEIILRYGVFERDLVADKVSWSDGLIDILEYKREELEDITAAFYYKHVDPADLPGLKKQIEDGLNSFNDFEYQHTIITKNKNVKNVVTNAKFIRNEAGEVIKMIGTVTEITERYKLYQELLAHQKEASEHEQLLKFGTWQLDMHTKILRWSRGMYLLFGYDADDAEHLPEVSEQIYLNHAADDHQRDRYLQFIRNISSHKDDYFFEYAIVDEKGHRKVLETLGTVIRDENNEAVKILGKTRDVTLLRQYEKDLEEKVYQLNRSNKDLEEFAYVASHDLQEPLRRINTFGERFIQKYNDQVPEDGKIYLERMMAASRNMGMLIDSLLSFSRLTRTDRPFEKTYLDEVLDSAISDLEQDLRNSGAIIKKDTLPVVEGIPVQLKQLFLNLISNSIKFRKPDKELVIDISSKWMSIDEMVAADLPTNKKFVMITVQDNGIGFENEYAKKIFQIFQRLHGKVEYPGSGIGLAICKKITENHRGSLIASGEPGKGARFTIILPEKQ